MNQDVKNEWISALRSGQYKQGRGFLKVGNKFCCLGVLCDLYSKETGISWSNNVTGVFLGHSLSLPDDVWKWADVGSLDPKIEGWSLSELNDKQGKSFEEIADLIEKHL